MQTEKTGVIYRIYHKESMKCYVGKTTDLINAFASTLMEMDTILRFAGLSRNTERMSFVWRS